MDTERWRRLQLLFEATLAQPDEVRSAFLDSGCRDDPELRDEVASLLAANARRSQNDTLPSAWLGVLANQDTPRFAAGDQVADRYDIHRLLGQGGMAEVYEAWDRELSIPVALKSLHLAAGTEHALQLLKLEGLLARSVSHPNVCRVYDLGRHGQGKATVWFLTMEVLRGETLSERLQEVGKLPLELVQRLGEQIAAGLGAAHQAGIVHRDLKTSNILLVGDGSDEQAVVTDFGMARAASLRATETGREGIMGTPAYMAPEQLQGLEVGPAADIYALGMVLYEMVTGGLPFPGSGIETARRRLSEPIPSPRSVRPEIDERWEAAILRCLEREPSQRFGRAEEVARALGGSVLIEEVAPSAQARHTLPAERDAFVGREGEIAELARDLGGHARLVTLLGAGGMGKTRLAVRYGWQSLGQWPGGVRYCDLTEARSVEAIASTVAGALDIQLGPGDPIEQLGNAIAGRGRCLLILDNFEQVASHAAGTLGRWLEKAGEARFLVTSREKLGLEEHEKVRIVESLSPEMGMELLTVRARWLRPGLDLAGPEAESAREIVRLVDGMPLAIELAATRMRVMSAAQIVQQMRSRFQLLTGGKSARHETLAVAIDGSWALLRPWEQAACAQCAVFEGGFTLAAAEGVLDLSAWPDAPWVVDVVQSLVDKSFLRTSVASGMSGGTAPEVRFGMYVSLQDYARMKLREGGMVDGGSVAERAAEERHGQWFARYGTDDMLAALDRHGGVRRRQQLGRELDNLAAACRRALARTDHKTAAATYRASWAVLELRGPFAGAVEIGRQILIDPLLEPAERAKTFRTLAQAERHSGRSEDARRHFEQAIAIHHELGDRRSEGIVLGNLAGLLHQQGLMVEAQEHYETALSIVRETGLRDYEGNILSNLGALCASQGRTAEARLHLETALGIHRELGNRRFEGVTLTTLGQIHFDQGRMTEARACGETALSIHREVGNRRFECAVLISLGAGLVEHGHLEEAGGHFENALKITREIGSLRQEGTVLAALGTLLYFRGLFAEATTSFERALALYRKMGDPRFEGAILGRLAELLHAQGKTQAVPEELVKGEEILRSLKDQTFLGEILCIRAKIECGAGNVLAARSALAEAEAIAAQVGCGPTSTLARQIREVRQILSVGR